MISRLIYFLYWCVQALGFPFILLYLLNRGRKDRRYLKNLAERFGRLPASFVQTAPGSVWLHAVSVGEVLSSVELLRRLRAELTGVRIFVSTATLAGRELAERRLDGIADGVFFAPIDYRFAVRRVLRALRPSLVLVMETEIWPNLYREARRHGCGLLVVNGRISDKAIPSYRRLRWFFRATLAWPDEILAQDETAAERYRELGAPRVTRAGNLKYDFDPAAVALAPELAEWMQTVPGARVWVAASTMPPAHPGDVDEDEAVIDAYRQIAPQIRDLLLVLVPRKPERFDEAAARLSAAGIPFVRRSALGPLALPGVLLLDSMGELAAVFSQATIVFMGGTLAQRGGHNVLEPAAFEKAIIAGPYMNNFAEIARDFDTARAMVRIASQEELAGTVVRLLKDDGERASIAARARQQAEAKRGATARAMEAAAALYDRRLFSDPGGAWRQPAAALWGLGVQYKRRRTVARELATPVISVGGISMGGAGKTPFVLWLARRLPEPAILTRGYRRRSREKITVFARGESAPVFATGDEAQIFARAKVAHVGIGGDRWSVGIEMERRFRPGVFLLDDGFQHWRLQRDCNIVLLDALDPFAGDWLFPRGRLREPREALGRADVIVITRSAGRWDRAIEHQLRQVNASAPVFRARTVAIGWRTLSGEFRAAPPTGAGAFCGLANPSSFWATLAALGIDPVFREAFPDHHRYTEAELRSLAAKAPVLLTTQKDALNLPPAFKSTSVLWLEIDMQVEGEAELLDAIRAAIPHTFSF